MKSKWEIDNTIDEIIKSIIVSNDNIKIYPNIVAEMVEAELNVTIERLLDLVQDLKLKLKYEVRCNAVNKYLLTIENLSPLEYIKGNNVDSVFCKYCKTEHEIEGNNIYLYFIPTNEYQDFLTKKIYSGRIKN